MSSSLIRPTALVAFALIGASASGQQRPVNDTGVISCTNEAWTQVTCESVNATLPGQDAAFGRDAMAVAGSLTKTGSGRRGFDLTKIAADGSVALATATFGSAVGQYRCVRDNTTGLVWEAYAEIRQWRDPNPATNGGFVGTENIGNTTDAYVTEANSGAGARCNRTTWRLPTARELLSITTFESKDRLLLADSSFFNSGLSTYFWTSQTNPAFPEHAFVVTLVDNGNPYPNPVLVKVVAETNKVLSQRAILVSSQ